MLLVLSVCACACACAWRDEAVGPSTIRCCSHYIRVRVCVVARRGLPIRVGVPTFVNNYTGAMSLIHHPSSRRYT